MDQELEQLVAVLGAKYGDTPGSNTGMDTDNTVLGKLSKIANNSEQTMYAVQGLSSCIQTLTGAVSLLVPVSGQSNSEKMNILERAVAHVASDEVTRLELELSKAEKNLHATQVKHAQMRQMLIDLLAEPGSAVARTRIQDILKALDRANEEEVRQAAE